MSNYFKDFKNERFHDENLIKLIEELATINKLSEFEELIGLNPGDCGRFIAGYKKRDFDVLLEFQSYNIVIETKVDSPEDRSNNQWQTDRIYENFHNQWNNKKKIFVYLTYGLSEFYIKEKQNGEYSNGAFNTSFRHIKCSQIHNFIEQSINENNIKNDELIIWNNWLRFEISKREQVSEYLKSVNDILVRYKTQLSLTDYPVNRINLFLPEFTVPFYYKICESWNHRNNELIGCACLYPVGRGYSLTNDSILNFWELWQTKKTLTCNGLLDDNYLYFEFNEDFNLHLKATDETPNINEVKNFVNKRAEELRLGFNSIIEDYKQGAYVLFEWDLNILSVSLDINLKNIERIITNAIKVLE